MYGKHCLFILISVIYVQIDRINNTCWFGSEQATGLIWTNDGLFCWNLYASLGFNELKDVDQMDRHQTKRNHDKARTTCRIIWKHTKYPNSKVHKANMRPTWVRQDPGGPHVGHMNLVIWAIVIRDMVIFHFPDPLATILRITRQVHYLFNSLTKLITMNTPQHFLTGPLWGDYTCQRLIPITKAQWRRHRFHTMFLVMIRSTASNIWLNFLSMITSKKAEFFQVQMHLTQYTVKCSLNEKIFPMVLND